MKEVTKDEFYKAIGPQDAITDMRTIVEDGQTAYAHTFKLRYQRTVLGEIIPKKELDRYPYFVKHYYLY